MEYNYIKSKIKGNLAIYRFGQEYYNYFGHTSHVYTLLIKLILKIFFLNQYFVPCLQM